MHSTIALMSDRFTAGVSPSLGGSLVWFGTRGHASDPSIEFVRATPVRALHDGTGRMASSYPLVPYSNRVADGGFEFDGKPVTLRRNTSIPDHPIHGVGFLRGWSVESPEVSANRHELAISLIHAVAADTSRPDPDWPWSFAARQIFTLDDHGLAISIAIANRDARPMPAGIGFHPFFPKSSSTRLRFRASAVWKSDARMLPEARIAVPKPFDFAEPRALTALDVDNCFAGWDGTADLEWPDRRWGLRIDASPVFGHLVVYTSPLRDTIAIEPVSHVNNALNLARERDDTGLVRLMPGETLEGTMKLTPFEL